MNSYDFLMKLKHYKIVNQCDVVHGINRKDLFKYQTGIKNMYFE